MVTKRRLCFIAVLSVLILIPMSLSATGGDEGTAAVDNEFMEIIGERYSNIDAFIAQQKATMRLDKFQRLISDGAKTNTSDLFQIYQHQFHLSILSYQP